MLWTLRVVRIFVSIQPTPIQTHVMPTPPAETDVFVSIRFDLNALKFGSKSRMRDVLERHHRIEINQNKHFSIHVEHDLV